MKCIWRILLGILTAGFSEVLRHKTHDKRQPCPDPVQRYVALETLNVGDFCIHSGLTFQVEAKGELVRLRHIIGGDLYDLPPEIKVIKLS